MMFKNFYNKLRDLKNHREYSRMKHEFFQDLEFDELKHYEETQQKILNKKDQIEKKSK